MNEFEGAPLDLSALDVRSAPEWVAARAGAIVRDALAEQERLRAAGPLAWALPWARPALAAAIAALLIATGELASMMQRHAVNDDALTIPARIERWALTEQRPSVAELMVALDRAELSSRARSR